MICGIIDPAAQLTALPSIPLADSVFNKPHEKGQLYTVPPL